MSDVANGPLVFVIKSYAKMMYNCMVYERIGNTINESIINSLYFIYVCIYVAPFVGGVDLCACLLICAKMQPRTQVRIK